MKRASIFRTQGKAGHQILRTVDTGKGYRIYRCEGRLYKIEKEAPPAEGGTGKWEIAIKDNFAGEWTVSTGQTPEGQFKKLGDALTALLSFIAKYPVPDQRFIEGRSI